MKKYKLLSIVIPAYNEEKFIADVVKHVFKAKAHGLKKEIIVVDDASCDTTPQILKKLEKKYGKNNLKIIYAQKNSGKGHALKTGFLNTKGDIVVIQDADFEYSPSEYERLLEPFFKDDADVVYGSRLVSDRSHRVLYFWHYLANKTLTTFSNIFTNLNLTDMETGYKVFRGDIIRKIAPSLESNRFGFEPEVTAKLAKLKSLKFYELGISYQGRTYSEGKKITWKDGVKALWQILRFNLLPYPPKIYHVISRNVNKLFKYLKNELLDLLSFPKKNPNKRILKSILVLAILLRTLGLTWGIKTKDMWHGSPYHDEGHVVNEIFDVNYFLKFGEYEISKPVYFWRLSALKFYQVVRYILPSFSIDTFLLLRSITTLFGITSVYVVFIIAKKLFNERIALLTTLFYTLLPGQWFMSQLIKGEALITFFIPATFLCLYFLYKKGSLLWFIITGSIIGLGLSTKANYLLISPLILLSFLVTFFKYFRKVHIFIFGTIVTLGIAFILFYKFYPYPFCCNTKYLEALLDPQNAFARANGTVNRLSLKVNPTILWTSYKAYENPNKPFFTIAFGKVLSYLFLTGFASLPLIIFNKLIKRKNILLETFILLGGSVLTLTLTLYGGIVEDRYVVPLSPFVALFSGATFYLVYKILKSTKIKKIINTFLVIIILYQFLFNWAYFSSYALFRPRVKLAKWAEQKIKEGKEVIIFNPGSRDNIYLQGVRSSILNLKQRDLGTNRPDYFVVFDIINNRGRWGNEFFEFDNAKYPYGENIPSILENDYTYVKSIGNKPTILWFFRLPDTLYTPVFKIYEKK